jgi:hypothetical protein
MTVLAAGQDISAALPPPPPRALHAIESGEEAKPIMQAVRPERVAIETTAVSSPVVSELDADHTAELEERIRKGNFPNPWSRAVEKQVSRWRDELLADQESRRPF